MRDLLNGKSGERLAGDAHWEQFERDFWQFGKPGVWKLERLQTFQEPDDESWIAFSKGDWAEALRLIEARHVDLQEEYRKIADHGFQLWRVRVADKPITPYLQWEFHCFQQRQRVGENIRVVGSDKIAQFEKDGVFPEIITLGVDVMYELWYDDTGSQKGGIRFVDRDLISRYQKVIQDIYSIAEKLESFFEREIAVLEAPTGA
ncbi:MAG: DUF6879 family protein [Pseudonocardiaceae bacterium]